MVKLDAMGLLCPAPVIMVKNAVKALPLAGGVVEISVDNNVACENLSKLCAAKGYQCKIDKIEPRRYAVTITVNENEAQNSFPKLSDTEENQKEGSADQAFASCQIQGALAVAISRDNMGSGSEELGKILIKGFIYSLTQLETPPKTLLFFNGGVKLTLKGANTLEDLQALQGKGTEIKICGTCVNYFNVKEQVAVGEIVNMYDITEAMSKAQPLINI